MARGPDKYFGAPVQLSDPANEAVAIVPGQALADPARSVYVGGAGDIAMKGTDDADFVVWKAVPAGSLLPFRVKEVRVAGTTATSLLALY